MHLTSVFQKGIISSVYPETGMAKVTFPDRSNKVSGPYPIIYPVTLLNQVYFMPDVGERVVVFCDPCNPNDGFILGSFYADSRKPPVEGEEMEKKIHVRFDDGTSLEYDKKEHKMTVRLNGDIEEGDISLEIKAKGNINIVSEKDISIAGRNSSIAL